MNAGLATTSGFFNSFFGTQAGESNNAGIGNSFFGYGAGHDNTTGDRNTFIGQQGGETNTIGNNNATLGWGANVGASNLSFATAIGSEAAVSNSNSITLGRSAGQDTVRVPGDLLVTDDFIVSGASTVNTLIVDTLGSAGAVDVCRNIGQQLSTCSSSLRYKSDVAKFSRGLDVVRRLNPITFKWRVGELEDVGFGAEEVNAVEPLLATRNAKGQIEGVKYKQITTVLVNAVKEQQQQIEKLTAQIDALRRLLCTQNPAAEICTEIQAPTIPK